MKVTAAIREATAEALACRPVCDGLETFPSADEPRVLVSPLTGDVDSLHQIYDKLQTGLKRLGFRPEPRPLKPHVTLGRVKGTRSLEDLKQRLETSRERQFGITAIDCVQLMLSEPRGKGSEYTVMEEFDLLE
jgi:RNA 2',3'-cyclic 3'-phosphodiesterase